MTLIINKNVSQPLQQLTVQGLYLFHMKLKFDYYYIDFSWELVWDYFLFQTKAMFKEFLSQENGWKPNKGLTERTSESQIII